MKKNRKKTMVKKVLTVLLALGTVCSLGGCMGGSNWMETVSWTETMTETAEETDTAAETGTTAQTDNSESAGTETTTQANSTTAGTETTAQTENGTAVSTEMTTQAESGEEEMKTMYITIGEQTFTATLYDNETAETFAESLPMTVNMSELNGNEKYYYMRDSLIVRAETPGQIQAGDLMLFGSDCLVLFYETFSTSYSYTPLGRIEDPSGLAEAVGSGDVEVTFALQ